MYIKDKVIKGLKIKNVIFMILGIFNVAVSGANMISLISHYSDQLETVLYAKSTPDSIVSIIIGTFLLVIACKSRSLIGDANFYSSYFEGSLDGYIKYGDLTEVTGKSEDKIKKQLHFFHNTYMKNYELETVNHIEQVVLNSKKCICECRNCAAPIEKRIYFTGICSYCGSSDLFARVLTDNRFYSIANNMSDGVKKPEFYSAKNLNQKKIQCLCYICLGIFIICIATLASMSNIFNYSNEEYLREVLLSGKSYSSYELIKAEIRDTIIWCIALALAFIPVVRNRHKRIKYINVADACSYYFSECKTPFVNVESLPVGKNIKGMMDSVRGALRRRYLLNCTLEKHDGKLKVALAKKIVKDQCPSCGAPIVGAVDEHYRCKYCGNVIMGVVRKK